MKTPYSSRGLEQKNSFPGAGSCPKPGGIPRASFGEELLIVPKGALRTEGPEWVY